MLMTKNRNFCFFAIPRTTDKLRKFALPAPAEDLEITVPNDILYPVRHFFRSMTAVKNDEVLR